MASRFAELWLAPRLGGDVDAGVHQPSWLVVNDRERHGTLRADTPERRGDDGPGERHLLVRRPPRPPRGATELWRIRLSAADVERGPRVIERDGELVWVCEGRELGGSGYAGADR